MFSFNIDSEQRALECVRPVLKRRILSLGERLETELFGFINTSERCEHTSQLETCFKNVIIEISGSK